MEPETKQQQFDADFIIMEAIFSVLIKKLLGLFLERQSVKNVVSFDKKLAVA